MIIFSLDVQRRLIQIKVYHKFFYSVWKEMTHKPSKAKQMWKSFSPVFMLLVQLASISYFYSMWRLEDIIFYKSLSLPWGSLQPPCSCVVWNKWFEISVYFNFYLHNTNTKVKVQCRYQSSKMKFSYTILKTL